MKLNSLYDVALFSLKNSLKVAEKETVAIVADEKMTNIAQAFLKAANDLKTDPVLAFIRERTRNGEEPPLNVAALMAASDVVIAVTKKSLSHTKAKKDACAKGARMASLPGITEECALRTLEADYEEISIRTKALSKILTLGNEAHIVCPNGTDIYVSLQNREGCSDTGEYFAKGAFGNLPAGEAFLAPYEGLSHGRIVFTTSLAGIGLLREPVIIEVEKGKAVKISGGSEADKLDNLLSPLGSDAYNIAELGIGTNDKARLTGKVLEDEKVFGTVHIALGDNSGFGGTVSVPVHLDGIIIDPDVYIDGELIISKGQHLYSF